MEIYILGGYLTILLYGVLLDDIKEFREYMTQLMEIVIKSLHIKKTHPYTLMFTLGVIFLFTSWVGFIGLMYLIIDFLLMKYKNKED